MAFRGLRFCKECFNILLPKERINGDERELQYCCRLCEMVEKAETESDHLVYFRELVQTVETRDKDYSDFALDPTLSRTKEFQCPKCSHTEAAFFHSDVTERGIQLTYVCTGEINGLRCGYSWTSA